MTHHAFVHRARQAVSSPGRLRRSCRPPLGVRSARDATISIPPASAPRVRQPPRPRCACHPHGIPSPSRRRRTRCVAGPEFPACAPARPPKRGCKDRVVVLHAGQNLVRIDRRGSIERDDKGFGRFDPLQQVHAVADRTRLAGVARQPGVPRRPGLAAHRQHAGIGMQHCVVGLVGHCAENRALTLVRIGQQRQRLIAVAGEHDMIEMFDAGGALDRDACGMTANRAHRTIQPLAHRPARAQRPHVTRRPTLNHAPLRTIGDLQHLVIGHELHQIACRETRESAFSATTTAPRPSAPGARRETPHRSHVRRDSRPASGRFPSEFSSAGASR